MTAVPRIAIVGGGPSGLFLYRSLIEKSPSGLEIDIFEAGEVLGAGMPYSEAGAKVEHFTNVSGNEVPTVLDSVVDWIKSLSTETLAEFGVDRESLTDFKVLPRLLFGRYLSAQFESLLRQGHERGIETRVHLHSPVVDVRDEAPRKQVRLIMKGGVEHFVNSAVLCTGHVWPQHHENRTPNYFDSPYPPQKLNARRNHPVAIRGASLTAIDAIRTLARVHGEFIPADKRTLHYRIKEGCGEFKLVMHSRDGLLPGIRFHLEDPQLKKREGLSETQIESHRRENEGFVSLDYLFERDFKEVFREKEPTFYKRIKDLDLEAFVESMMKEREQSEAFVYFKREYQEALKSIRNEESIYWKEKLAILSFSLNRPAKYFSAEDTIRLQEVLMTLISVVIAFAPQRSCEELIALHDAGRLELKMVGDESEVIPQAEGGIIYRYSSPEEKDRSERFLTFVDCIGQRHLSFEQFPFEGLKSQGIVAPAGVRFRSAERARQLRDGGNQNVIAQGERFDLRVPGVAIGDHFEVIGADGMPSSRIYAMAVPLIGGHNPDYSGLDFCQEAAERITDHIKEYLNRGSGR